MNITIRLALLFCCILLTMNTQAEHINEEREFIHGRVTGIKTGTDILFIYMEELPTACGTQDKRRLAVKASHPLFKVIVELALNSHMHARDVTITYKDSCKIHPHALDFKNMHLH